MDLARKVLASNDPATDRKITVFDPDLLRRSVMEAARQAPDMTQGRKAVVAVLQETLTHERANAEAILFSKRNGMACATYAPHRNKNDSGVGTQMMTGDINNDSITDIVITNKHGVFVFTK